MSANGEIPYKSLRTDLIASLLLQNCGKQDFSRIHRQCNGSAMRQWRHYWWIISQTTHVTPSAYCTSISNRHRLTENKGNIRFRAAAKSSSVSLMYKYGLAVPTSLSLACIVHVHTTLHAVFMQRRGEGGGPNTSTQGDIFPLRV